MSLSELKRLDAGVRFGRHFAGERIPTLDEVFDALGDRCGLDIELKDGAADAQVCAIIRERCAYDLTVVSSFDWAALRRVKARDTSIRIGVLADKRPELMIAEAGALGAWSVNPRYTLCTAELVSEAHRNAFKVLVWTIDDPSQMRRMIANGVDGIVTNDPKRLGTLIR